MKDVKSQIKRYKLIRYYSSVIKKIKPLSPGLQHYKSKLTFRKTKTF